jgi:hypothetical protein
MLSGYHIFLTFSGFVFQNRFQEQGWIFFFKFFFSFKISDKDIKKRIDLKLYLIFPNIRFGYHNLDNKT